MKSVISRYLSSGEQEKLSILRSMIFTGTEAKEAIPLLRESLANPLLRDTAIPLLLRLAGHRLDVITQVLDVATSANYKQIKYALLFDLPAVWRADQADFIVDKQLLRKLHRHFKRKNYPAFHLGLVLLGCIAGFNPSSIKGVNGVICIFINSLMNKRNREGVECAANAWPALSACGPLSKRLVRRLLRACLSLIEEINKDDSLMRSLIGAVGFTAGQDDLVLPVLRDLALYGDLGNRIYALNSLVRMNTFNTFARDQLIGMLCGVSQFDEPVRRKAVEILGGLDTTVLAHSMAEMEHMADDPDPGVRTDVGLLLARIRGADRQ